MRSEIHRKNPFPRKSVIAIEGTTTTGPLYTLVTPQIARASQYALEYFEDRLGQVISVSGPYGSGKSHLIEFVRKSVAQAAVGDGSRRFVQIYQKAANADFISFYQDLVEQIGLTLLQEVNDRFLGVVAAKEIMSEEEEKKKRALLELLSEDKRNDAQAEYEASKRKMVERLRTNPGIVYRYLDKLIIQPEAVYDQRAADLQEIAGEDFKKAFFYLPNAGLKDAAYKWFTAGQLTDDEMARLGVRNRLTTAEHAKYALFLLVTLFRHAEIGLFIYLDQIEKLLIDTEEAKRDENRGVLFGLAEICPRENAFLALIGAEDGWALMREDLWTRIGSTQIRLGQIPAEWGRALLDVYLNEREARDVKKEIEESNIAPFSFAAADEMLRISKGNVRLFLQICHDVFKMHGTKPDAPISPEQVKEAIGQQVDEGSVAAQIQSILRGRQLTFNLQPSLGLNFRPDIVIGDPASPSAVIEIVNPLFYVDEAKKAIEITNQKNELASKYPGTHLIIVSIGYASAEVEAGLERIVDDYLVYQHQSFIEDFGTVLNSLSVDGKPGQEPTAEIQSETKDSLQQLLAEREKEISDLNERLKLLSEQQKVEVLPRQQEWRAWLRTDQEKWEQRAADLETKSQQEREQLQDAGERIRSRKLIITTVIDTVLSLIAVLSLPYSLAVLWTRVTDHNSRFFDETPTLTYPHFYRWYFLFLAICVVVSLLVYYLAIYRRFLPLGFKTGEIGKYRGDLSQLIVRARTNSISLSRARLCLKNSNPIIRYFGALVFLSHGRDDTSEFPSSEAANEHRVPQRLSSVRWSRLAAIEGWKPLYLAYLQMAFREENTESIQKLFDLLLEANADDPRIVYLISTIPERESERLRFELRGVNAASPAFGRVLSHALLEHTLDVNSNWRRTPAARMPLARFVQALVEPSSNQTMVLADWFREHGQFWHRELKGTVELDLTEQELISMIEAVSPHRECGLAAFRDLPIFTLYLRLYRFFSEIQWRFEQGDVILKQ